MSITHNIRIIIRSFANIFIILFEGWTLSKVLNFSNLLKLLFIYIASIIIVIIIDFDVSKGFWLKAIRGEFSEKRMSFYSVKNRIGERALYERTQELLERQNYDYSGSLFTENFADFWFTRHLYVVATNIMNYVLQPKFNFFITHHTKIIPYGYNVMYINMPRDSIYTPDGKFKKKWSHLQYYDAYADIHSLVYGDNKILKIAAKGKKIIPLYFAHPDSEYKEVSFDKALITGSLWGCNRGSLRVKMALKMLADEDMIVAIGLPDALGYLGTNYLGRLEKFGDVLTAIKEQHQKYGIALVMHSQEHMLDGIPTSRIPEAAVNGALIISDRNYFLTKFFGDNVLYFDVFSSEEEIYQQVKKHILWARNNPKLALEKTKNAHDIFSKNFTMEKQLEFLFNAASQH